MKTFKLFRPGEPDFSSEQCRQWSQPTSAYRSLHILFRCDDAVHAVQPNVSVIQHEPVSSVIFSKNSHIGYRCSFTVCNNLDVKFHQVGETVGSFFCINSLRVTRWRSWLMHCATSRKVAGSIPDGITGIFQWVNPCGRTVALGSTQPLTEMSTRIPSWG
jgi:hypothetical protein